jgi:glyoxylase-like metal-dependent hydrolase (beta-lactamase superfamily II)
MAENAWFAITRFPHAVTMIGEPHHDEDVKSYLIEGSRDVAVLDTGLGPGDFPAVVAANSARRPVVLQTHAHWDHIGASHRFEEVFVHPTEADVLRAGYASTLYVEKFSPALVDETHLPADFDPRSGIPGREPTGWLEHGDQIDLGDRVLEVFHTPGHSPGGVSFLDRQARALFVGDLLYLGPMYIFLHTSNPKDFLESLRLAAELADEVDVIYPAHGDSPLTPADARTITEAFEAVWAGRTPNDVGSLFSRETVIHDFGRFSFLLPPNWETGRVSD